MAAKNKAKLFDTYLKLHESANKAEKEGDYGSARKLYGEACEALLAFASQVEGNFKQAYLDTFDAIAAKAESLPASPEADKASQAATSKPGKSAPQSTGRDSDETEFFEATIPETTFADVAGLENVKAAIRTRIIKPREHPEVYKALNKKPGGGVLMYGPPGTGKTMIAQAIANEVGAVFFDVKCSQIVQKYFGVAERNVKNLFETARKHKVAIIFFDEFEALGAKRGGNSTVMERLVPELLSQIQGFSGQSNTLLIIAATNRPGAIDSAFLRPGRFSELLFIDLPDKEARMHIIEKAYEGVPLEEGVSIEALAERLEGYNAADVVEFCDRSKDPTADRCIDEHNGDTSKLLITAADIEETALRVKSSVHPKDLADLEKFRNQFQK